MIHASFISDRNDTTGFKDMYFLSTHGTDGSRDMTQQTLRT
jgi:hypothetical protein